MHYGNGLAITADTVHNGGDVEEERGPRESGPGSLSWKSVAYWLRSWTGNRRVDGSNPDR